MTQDPPAPVCPRHPDRVAYVRCQRCDRPVQDVIITSVDITE